MKALAREILCWYLSRCPVTEGKGLLYRTFAEALLPEQPEVVVRVAPGFQMALALSESAQREIFYFGTYERKESALIRKLLRPGDVFWDVGANLGYYTLLGATCVGSGGHVVAFEPFAPAWERLQKNLDLNGFAQVATHRVAVGLAKGTATLYFARAEADGVASFIPPDHPACSVACEVLSVDEFLREHCEPPPTVMKVDVEGWEHAVLKGALDLLAGPAAPMLLLEMEDAHFVRVGTSRREIEAALFGLGYVACQPRGRRWVVCSELGAVRGRSVFWLIPSRTVHRERARAAGILELPTS